MSITPEKPTLFPINNACVRSFDVAPLLDLLTRDGSADEIIRILDQSIHELSRFYLDHDGGHGGASTNLFYLRSLRNSFTKGAAVFCFDGD